MKKKDIDEKVIEKKKAHMEGMLTSASAFRQGLLELYCDVPVRDIEYMGKAYGGNPELGIQDERNIDFLLCQKGDVLVAIQLTAVENESERKAGSLPGLPVLSFNMWELNSATEDFMEGWLERKLKEEKTKKYSFKAYVLRPKLQQILVKKYLLKEEVSEVPLRTVTEYGKDSGIIEGYSISKEGRVCRRLFCSERGRGIILENLKWNRENLEKQAKKMPFSERIKKLNEGIPSDGMYMVSIIKKFANMPVDRYLKNVPNALEELKKELYDFDGLEGSITYQQAAVSIYKMIQSEEKKEMGYDMMGILTIPAYEALKRRRGNVKS